MLKQETFINGITVLQKFFLKWEFNSKDELQMRIWYNALSAIEDDEFMGLIETYCTSRIHAPSSPNDLLTIMAEEEEKKWPDPFKAFAQVRQLIRDNGWEYGRSDIYEAIRPNVALYKTVKDMEPELRELTTDDKFLPERFRKEYEKQLKIMCIRKRDQKLSNPQLPSNDTAGFLPYEK